MTLTPLQVANKLAEWEAQLPPAPTPVGSYVPCVQTGNFIYTSGALPLKDGQLIATGYLGGDSAVSIDTAQEAARQCILNSLAVLKAQLGSLEKVKKVVKLTGFVSSHPSFYDQPAVINGASDLLVEIFGAEIGSHADLIARGGIYAALAA